MAQWVAFAALTGVVLALLLVLSHLTTVAFEDGDDLGPTTDRDHGGDERVVGPRFDPSRSDGSRDVTADRTDAASSLPSTEVVRIDEPSETGVDRSRADGSVDGRRGEEVAGSDGPAIRGERTDDRGVEPESLSTAALLANVAVSQGLFAVVLIGGAIYTGIPADALGIAFDRAYLREGLVVGVGLGVVLYALNEVGAAGAKRAEIDLSEELRELLAPESAGGWLVLLFVVLPIIAVFEELLFRAALVGALSVGFGISPWLLAVGSSVAFAVGHGMQGTAGVIVTGTLGFVLAAAFVLTGSLLVVIVAHYLINVLEFVVHEGLDVDPLGTTGS